MFIAPCARMKARRRCAMCHAQDFHCRRKYPCLRPGLHVPFECDTFRSSGAKNSNGSNKTKHKYLRLKTKDQNIFPRDQSKP